MNDHSASTVWLSNQIQLCQIRRNHNHISITSLDNISVSVTAIAVAESRIITSYFPRMSLRKSIMRFEPRSSEGFGDNVPAVIIFKLFNSEDELFHLNLHFLKENQYPGDFCKFNKLCIPGFLKSISINREFFISLSKCSG